MSDQTKDYPPPASVSVVVQTTDGEKFQGKLLRLTRYGGTIEFSNPLPIFQLSQILKRVEIVAGDQPIYSGRATISGLAHTGLSLTCEIKFEAAGAEGGIVEPPPGGAVALQKAYDRFYQSWSQECRIQPEFKALVVDVEDFLDGVRRWLEQVEFGFRLKTNGRWQDHEAAVLEVVAPSVTASFNLRHQQFEDLAYGLPPEARSTHHAFVQRHWHRHFLLSPFGHRTYFKPKGYAGDYEMMNMIHRNQPEGDSLYAKVIHCLLVSQWPALSVRNRIAHLGKNLINESVRLVQSRRRVRVLNIGCGPAREIQNFMRDSALSDRVDFTLIDFDSETLDYVRQKLHECKKDFHRQTGVQTKKISVYDFLRKAKQDKPSPEEAYDLIYCAGLFDYLTMVTGQALIDLWFQWLAPGGLLLVANMNDSKPFRNFIEATLEWRLIYRNTDELLSLVPERLLPVTRVVAEDTTVNMFLHIRKSETG